MGRILSTIDIGSNTAHLLVAEVGDGSVRRIVDESDWLSLGEIVGRERCVPGAMQDAVIRTVGGFRRKASAEGAERLWVFATEAMRRASNGQELRKRIEQATGVKVEVVSAQTEAELAMKGALLDSEASSFLLVEVGGGSAQVARCSRKRIKAEASLGLGTGTLIAKLGLTSPCDYAHLKRIQRTVQEALEDADVFGDVQAIVGSGGVVRGLWRALHPEGERTLHMEELNYLIWATQRLTADAIVARFQVKPKRAYTLLPGAVVYRQILEHAGHEEMVVSRYGVREGALLEMSEGSIEGQPV